MVQQLCTTAFLSPKKKCRTSQKSQVSNHHSPTWRHCGSQLGSTHRQRPSSFHQALPVAGQSNSFSGSSSSSHFSQAQYRYLTSQGLWPLQTAWQCNRPQSRGWIRILRNLRESARKNSGQNHSWSQRAANQTSATSSFIHRHYPCSQRLWPQDSTRISRPHAAAFNQTKARSETNLLASRIRSVDCTMESWQSQIILWHTKCKKNEEKQLFNHSGGQVH